MQTVENYLNNLKLLVGSKYWLGTYGAIATEALWTQKSNQSGLQTWYANHASDKSPAIGKRVADCIGVDKFCRWLKPDGSIPYDASTDFNDEMHLTYAKTKGMKYGTMDTMPDVPGICLGFKGHFGVYVGNGKSWESRPTYGFVEYDVHNRINSSHQWEYWYYNPFLDYGEGVVMLKRGDKNDNVKIWQEFLNIEMDGSFGPATEASTNAFKKSVGLAEDGIVDFSTLLKALNKDEKTINALSSQLANANATIKTRDTSITTINAELLSLKSRLQSTEDALNSTENDLDEVAAANEVLDEENEKLLAELAVKPTEVIKEVVKEVPVEVIKEVEVVKEIEKKVPYEQLDTATIIAILCQRFKDAFKNIFVTKGEE